MQKIFLFLSYRTAKITPEVIAAGRAGGIAIVIRSMNLLKVDQASRYVIDALRFASIPIKATSPRAHAKSKESQWNLNLDGQGNRMLLTSNPLVVS